MLSLCEIRYYIAQYSATFENFLSVSLKPASQGYGSTTMICRTILNNITLPLIFRENLQKNLKEPYGNLTTLGDPIVQYRILGNPR